jgi:hypothetical protein
MREEIFQESPTQKAAWLEAAQRRFPVGARVRVVKSDVSEYIGALGTVVDYDCGANGDWPLIGVRFDTPIQYAGSTNPTTRDGFYGDGDSDDEIALRAVNDTENDNYDGPPDGEAWSGGFADNH